MGKNGSDILLRWMSCFGCLTLWLSRAISADRCMECLFVRIGYNLESCRCILFFAGDMIRMPVRLVCWMAVGRWTVAGGLRLSWQSFPPCKYIGRKYEDIKYFDEGRLELQSRNDVTLPGSTGSTQLSAMTSWSWICWKFHLSTIYNISNEEQIFHPEITIITE